MRLKSKIEKILKSRYVIAAVILALGSITPISSVLYSSSTVNAASLSGKKVKEVSTGFDTACATIEGWAYCWGANDLGQLGIGKTTAGATSAPVAVSSNTTAVPGDPICKRTVWFVCVESVPGPPKVPASAMAGKYVEKVSVGYTHACAIADASVYCWGDNSHGQLGNRSTTNALAPVKVDVQATDQTGKPKSALAQKEIVDVATGEFFSCALASDGTVACWGEGDQGRLGTGSESDVNYPKAVDTAPGSPLAGKKGVKLARASIATMCVLAVGDTAFTSGTKKGNPYCWGVGIGNDTIPGPGRVTVPCSKTSPTSRPTGSGSTVTYFTSATPIQISSTQMFTQVDGVDYLTGLSDNNRAYYWGMHGYRENNTYVSTTSCSINPCTSMNNTIRLAVSAGDASKKNRQKAQNNARNSNKPGGDKNKNLSSNQTAQQAAQNAARGGVASSVHASGGNLIVRGSLSSTDSYSSSVARNVSGSNVVVTSYRGVARPGGSASGANQTGGNNNNNNCARVTHYGYTADRTVDEIGKMTPTIPHASSLNQSNLSTLAGNVEAGLFCATNTSGTTFCDANGTGVNEGQTGSGYTKKCTTTGFIFTQTTCDPAPTGPQQVVANGWLAGKSVSQLSVGLSGYACALANNAVGCWGVNGYGQLGTGDTANKNVPTALKLQ